MPAGLYDDETRRIWGVPSTQNCLVFCEGLWLSPLISVVSSVLHVQSPETEKSQMGIQEKHRDEPLEDRVC